MDKVVVITGASAGIGAVLAEMLGKRGASVVIAARREGALADVAARLPASRVLPVVADVTRRADVERILARAVERFRHVDVWVNNAGRGISRPVMQLTDEDVDEMMRVNVKSALYGMQAAVTHFIERGCGHVVNVSSMLGRMPFAPIRSAYSASKHALNALSANLRMELRADHPNIRVSTVHPGVVATDFGRHSMHGGADSRRLPDAQPPEEVAEVIARLIESPRADVYTRDGARERVASYFAADDMAEVESKIVMRAPPSAAKPSPTS